MTPPAVKPVAGPRWTQKRLVDMLAECYGPSKIGPIDTVAVAGHVGVTAATVRRWLRNTNGPPSRVRAAIPRERITQLQRARPDVEDSNDRRYQYALQAIDKVDRGDIIPPWRTQGWLAEHTVAIVAVRAKPWHQVVVTKANHRALMGIRRRADIMDSAVVRNRFWAQVVAHNVMVRQQHWRVYPAQNQLDTGRTQVWMADAPPISLESFVADVAAAIIGKEA
ncbi:hypothetical protein KL864_31220 [Mycolicibacterium goodii]|uniref:hypothetical protein n=1 Tax=Mycolicibacterium goodii TaxID=134601 RepID=UPI001BDD70A2|nr:hypothetical protein [Mycolicibacterium goodii]MBU8820354.1 hypothetical protein [Mycolicibacterium goodii]